jgi:hypothetical protein
MVASYSSIMGQKLDPQVAQKVELQSYSPKNGVAYGKKVVAS